MCRSQETNERRRTEYSDIDWGQKSVSSSIALSAVLVVHILYFNLSGRVVAHRTGFIARQGRDVCSSVRSLYELKIQFLPLSVGNSEPPPI